MHRITIITRADDHEVAASVAGDVLTFDGVAFDLSAVPEGGEATPTGDHPFVGQVQRSAGDLVYTLAWPFDVAGDALADQPGASVDIASGAIPDPIARGA